MHANGRLPLVHPVPLHVWQSSLAKVELTVFVEPEVMQLLHPLLLDFAWAPLVVLLGEPDICVVYLLLDGSFHEIAHLGVTHVDATQLRLVEVAPGAFFG